MFFRFSPHPSPSGPDRLRPLFNYWDSNSTTAGAGATPTGTWGTSAFWNTDPFGITNTFSTATANTDDLYFVAGPASDSGNNAYTVTVSGAQVANSLNFQASGATTIAPGTSLTLGDGTAGHGGINIGQYAYGTTAQGSVLLPTITLNNSQTWVNNAPQEAKSYANGQNLAITGPASSTLTLTGLGQWFFVKETAGNVTVALDGARLPIFHLANNTSKKMLLKNGGIWSVEQASGSPPATFGTLLTALTFDVGGGYIDVAACVAQGTDANTLLTVGSSGNPVTLGKEGWQAFNMGAAAANSSVDMNAAVYGGKLDVSGLGTTVCKIYSADLVGGDIASAAGQWVTASGALTGKVRVQASGGRLGVYRVMNGSQATTDLTSDSRGGVYYLGYSVAPPTMSSLGDGKMWLGGNQTVSATANLAGSDGTYRITGNTYSGLNAFTGSGSLLIGSQKGNGAATVTFNTSAQNFTGTVTINAPYSDIFPGANFRTGIHGADGLSYATSTLTLSVVNALGGSGGSAPTINVGPNSTLTIGVTGGAIHDSAAITLNNAKLNGNVAALSETMGALTVKGASQVAFGTTGSTPSMTFASIANSQGGLLVVPDGSLNLGKVVDSAQGANATVYRGNVLVGTAPATALAISAYNTGNGIIPATYTLNPVETSWTSSTIGKYWQANLTLPGGTTTIGGLNLNRTLTFGANNLIVDNGIVIVERTAAGVAGGTVGNGAVGVSGDTGTITAGANAPVDPGNGQPTLYFVGTSATAPNIIVFPKVTGNINVALYNFVNRAELFNPNNDFVGNVYVSSQFRLLNDGVFGNAANTVYFNGGSIILNNPDTLKTVAHPVNILEGGLVVGGTTAPLGQGGTTVGNPITFSGRVSGSGIITVGCPIYSSGGLERQGPGGLRLTNPLNDFTGEVHLFAGVNYAASYDQRGGIRAGAVNVFGNNAAYVMEALSVMDLTDNTVGGAG